MSLIRRWICTNSTKNMLVKIVHPGGHVELHDRPLLASEVMSRNPRCVVALPHIFREPRTAVVRPDTMLLLGQKYYVVPVSTVRKLQSRSFKNNNNNANSSNSDPQNTTDGGGRGPKQAGARGDGERIESEKLYASSVGSKSKRVKCFVCLLKVGDKLGDFELSFCGTTKSPERERKKKKKKKKKEEKKKKKKGEENKYGHDAPDPEGLSAIEYWQPRLDSIREDLSV